MSRTDALVRIVALDGLQKPDIAFRNQIGDRRPVPAVTYRDLCDQAQMAGQEPVRSNFVAALTPVRGQRVFLISGEHRKAPN